MGKPLPPGVGLPADHDYLPAMGPFRVWRRGDPIPPLSPMLSPATVRRRRFAEKLADSMAYGDQRGDRRLIGNDFVAESSVYVPVAASELAQRVILDAEMITELVMLTPGQTRVYHPYQSVGFVVLVHGPDWSLVFEISSLDTVIRVCGDNLGDTALAIDEDPDRQTQSRMLTMTYDVLFQLQRMAIGGDLYKPDDGDGQ